MHLYLYYVDHWALYEFYDPIYDKVLYLVFYIYCFGPRADRLVASALQLNIGSYHENNN